MEAVKGTVGEIAVEAVGGTVIALAEEIVGEIAGEIAGKARRPGRRVRKNRWPGATLDAEPETHLSLTQRKPMLATLASTSSSVSDQVMPRAGSRQPPPMIFSQTWPAQW